MSRATLLLLLYMPFVGCSSGQKENTSWNFASRNIMIELVDAAGNNLLDSLNPGNILENRITAEFQGQLFTIIDGEEVSKEVDFYATWYGLRVSHKFNQKNNPMLFFGEFSPVGKEERDNRGYYDERLIIDWGDGVTDIIRFDLYVYSLDGNNPALYHSIYLNNEYAPVEEPLKIKIIR